MYNGLEKCKCMDTWGGDNCDIYMGHDNPCLNHCLNGGLCTISSTTAAPECYCVGGWIGRRCEKPGVCADHCLNGATCSVTDNIPYCT